MIGLVFVDVALNFAVVVPYLAIFLHLAILGYLRH